LKFIAPKVVDVMNAVSEEISLSLFKLIKESTKNTESLTEELKISYKQFYDRIQKLINTGLIKRENRYYTITSFGHVVYAAQAIVSKGIEIRSILKILDVTRRSDLPKDEYAKFVDQFIDDLELREIVAKQVASSP
jgi:predicted transcriptional regulator